MASRSSEAPSGAVRPGRLPRFPALVRDNRLVAAAATATAPHGEAGFHRDRVDPRAVLRPARHSACGAGTAAGKPPGRRRPRLVRCSTAENKSAKRAAGTAPPAQRTRGRRKSPGCLCGKLFVAARCQVGARHGLSALTPCPSPGRRGDYLLDAGGGTSVTGRLLPPVWLYGQGRLASKSVKLAPNFTNGREKYVFWRKWGVWLKESAGLRR